MSGCEAPSRPDRPDIFVLVIDALRPGHMGCYGYPRETTPTLDSLTASGAVFEHALSAANYTLASVPSIFTGVFPSVHGVVEEGDRLSDEVTTLAERLRDLGYATAAFAPNPSLGRRFNFGQGFDLYDDKALRNDETVPWRHFETAERIQSAALRFLDARPSEPHFLYLHYRDVHGPYVPPPPYDRMFLEGSELRPPRQLTPAEISARPDYLTLDGAPEELDYYLAQYDGEIRYTDDRIAELLAALKQRGRLRRAWIIVTADHGESFLEHGVWNHGSELFEEEIHVPLIIVAPDGRGRGRRIAYGAQGTDLFPTLLQMAGAPVPAGIQGQSLLSLLEGAVWPERTRFAEGRGRAMVRLGRHKLLWHGVERRYMLFDLQVDPGETRDLLAGRKLDARRLEHSLRRFVLSSRELARSFPRERVAVDGQLERELRALGYLQ